MTGVNITFPFSLKSLLAYVGFLLAPKVDGGRGLQGKSVEKYLSAIRLLHMQKGFFEPYIRPEIIKQITRGAVIRDQVQQVLQLIWSNSYDIQRLISWSYAYVMQQFIWSYAYGDSAIYFDELCTGVASTDLELCKEDAATD